MTSWKKKHYVCWYRFYSNLQQSKCSALQSSRNINKVLCFKIPTASSAMFENDKHKNREENIVLNEKKNFCVWRGSFILRHP